MCVCVCVESITEAFILERLFISEQSQVQAAGTADVHRDIMC